MQQQQQRQQEEEEEEEEYHQEKKGGGKVKKGWLAVEVGLEEDEGGGGTFERFVIPISYLYHPLFKRLLDKAHDVYGYHTSGPLRLPCSPHDFLNLKSRIDNDLYSNSNSKHSNSSSSSNHTPTSRTHHHHLPLTLSFHFH